MNSAVTGSVVMYRTYFESNFQGHIILWLNAITKRTKQTYVFYRKACINVYGEKVTKV